MAVDTYSSTIGVILMGTGNDNNTWGTNANDAVFQIFEDAIANALTSAVSGGTLDLSGNPPPAGPSQVRYAALIFTGTLTANQTVKVPNLPKWWWVNNQTGGNFNLNIQTYNGSSLGTGSLVTLGALTGGAGYISGTYYNVPLTGGSGFGAAATIVVTSGTITGVTLTEFGKYYLSTDTLSASASNLGGSGSGFSVAVSTVGNVIPQNSGWQLVQCDGNGNINVGPFNFEQIQMPDGSASAPAFSNINETNSGWYRYGTQDWRLSVEGTDIFQVTGSGAATPSVVNALNGSLQQQGVQIIPPGTELPFAGVNLPSGFLWEYGQAVSRTTYNNLLAALRATFTGNVTNGSNTIASVSADLRNLGLEGAALEGSGLTGLTVVSLTATTITMSGNATAGSGGSQTCYAYPYGNGDGSTTFNVPDRRGRVIAGRDNMGTAGSSAAGRLTASTGVIATFGSITGGSNYTPGIYENVPLTGGAGSGALANITVNSSGAISAASLSYGGIDYLPSDTLSAAAASLGGTGVIASLGTIIGGSGYVNGTYNNVPLIWGNGSGATANIVVSSNVVSSVTLVKGGENFTAGNTLSASASNLGGSGSGFSIPVSTTTSASGFSIQVSTVTTTGVAGINLTSAGGEQSNSTSLTLSSADQLPQIIPAGAIGGSYNAGSFFPAGGGEEMTGGPPLATVIGGQNIIVPGSSFSFTGSTIGSAAPSAAITAPFATLQPTGVSNMIIKT